MISKYNQIPENNGSIDTILDVYFVDSLCANSYLQAAFTPSITHTPSFSHFFKAHRSSVGVVGGRGWEIRVVGRRRWEVGVVGGRGWEETKCEISTGQKWETIYYKVVLSSTLRRNNKKKNRPANPLKLYVHVYTRFYGNHQALGGSSYIVTGKICNGWILDFWVTI